MRLRRHRCRPRPTRTRKPPRNGRGRGRHGLGHRPSDQAVALGGQSAGNRSVLMRGGWAARIARRRWQRSAIMPPRCCWLWPALLVAVREESGGSAARPTRWSRRRIAPCPATHGHGTGIATRSLAQAANDEPGPGWRIELDAGTTRQPRRAQPRQAGVRRASSVWSHLKSSVALQVAPVWSGQRRPVSPPTPKTRSPGART